MKPIKDFPNYFITENGEVYSKNRNRFLKPMICTGYFKFGLLKKCQRKYFFAHRLVAQAYIPNENSKLIVNHKDGNKKNNHVSNLEWCTYSQNQKHAYDNGLCELTRKKSSESGKIAIKFAQKSNQKLVLNITTGIFYESAKEAAKACNIRYEYLSLYLRNKKENKTNLIYV